MLSLWKLRVGAEAYYLAQVARGLDDYYTGQGEVPGVWIGSASPALGLHGEVDPEDLRAVLAGLAPGTGLTPNGEQLRTHRRRVPGFDLTFSVPKSVSVVYAIGDPLVRGEVIAASEAALTSTVAWLEREACHVRRGTNNRSAKVSDVAEWGTRRLPGAGFVAAAFRHRVSRAGDPQLHWHVLVANTTSGPDGRWTALDATSLYRTKRAAGVAFQAALRAELTRRLGVAWLPARNDVAEIAGVPTRILRLFSKRREQIETELARTGSAGPVAAARATLATRADRSTFDPEGIEAAWHTQALAAGWGADHLDRLLAQPAHPRKEPSINELVAVISERLLDTDSTFTRHDITQAVAASLPAGADPTRVDQLTAGVVAHPDIVPLRHDRAAGWEQRYTTRQLLAIETELVATIANRTSAPVAALSHDRIAVAVRNATTLGPDQQHAVMRLLSQGNPVEVLVGRAGTGKTFTLATIARAYQLAGFQPIGVAPSARAARELADGTGLISYTVPRYHHAIGRQPLTARSVVIVDEAGMCGTFDLHSVLTTARAAGAKVILVGDHHQLPEVAAGGGFRTAVAALGDKVCELTVNRRVTEPWETRALDELRHGNVKTAWDAYRTHGRVTIAQDHADIRTHASNDWWASHARGERAFLLAGTRAETVVLNDLARHRAATAGLLHGPALETHGRLFQAGDRVLLTRNDAHQHGPDGQRVRVDNGTLATITRVHPDRTLTIALDNSETVRLGRAYIEAGWVQHGYAMTIHKSQGATCDRVFIVGPAGLYREAAYVAMSRARYGAWLYATADQAAGIELGHSAGIPLPDDHQDPEHALIALLERSEAKHLALASAPHAPAAATLAHTNLRELHQQLAHARWVHALLADAGLQDPSAQQRTIANAIAVRELLAVGGRVRALDRDNVGRIDAINDRDGTATITFTSNGGRHATRDLAWADLKPIDHPSPQPVPNAARQWLSDRQTETDRLAQRWARALAEHGLTPDSQDVLETAVRVRTARTFEAFVAARPDWLQWWIGQRPADPIGATTWDDTVHRIATWRDAHQVPDTVAGLGNRPTANDAAAGEAWHNEMADILRARQWLTTRAPQPDPVDIHPLQGIELAERIAELDRLLDTAPPDYRPVIDQLLHGGTDPDALHDLLAQAHRNQTARRNWILTNWPHVVEREQLARLLAGSDPLAHWPQPTTDTVRRALNQLRETVPPPQTPEHRTLQQLTTELNAADPEEHLAKLTADVARLQQTLRALQTTRTAQPTERETLITSEIAVLRRELDDAVERLTSAQADAHRIVLHDTTLDDLHEAFQRRVEQLVYTAIHDAQPWLIDELANLDNNGTLTQLDPAVLYQHVASMAAKHELPDIERPQPTLSIPS